MERVTDVVLRFLVVGASLHVINGWRVFDQLSLSSNLLAAVIYKRSKRHQRFNVQIATKKQSSSSTDGWTVGMKVS